MKKALLLSSLLILVSMIGYVWIRMATIESSRILSRLMMEYAALEDENTRLRTDVVHLMSSQRICTLASEKLGMEFPKKLPFELKPLNEEIR